MRTDALYQSRSLLIFLCGFGAVAILNMLVFFLVLFKHETCASIIGHLLMDRRMTDFLSLDFIIPSTHSSTCERARLARLPLRVHKSAVPTLPDRVLGTILYFRVKWAVLIIMFGINQADLLSFLPAIFCLTAWKSYKRCPSLDRPYFSLTDYWWYIPSTSDEVWRR